VKRVNDLLDDARAYPSPKGPETPRPLLAWLSMERAPEPSPGRLGAVNLACAALVGAFVLLASFAGDGSDFDGVLPVGGAAAALLVAFLVAFSFGLIRLPRVGLAGAALLLATVLLAAWTAATVAWSIAPDRSWDTANRNLVYAVFLGLGIVLAGVAGRAAARVGAWVLAGGVSVVLCWALLAKAIPALDPEGDRIARLREPVGYWNVLALLAAIALPLALWVGATSGRRLPMRVLGGLLMYAAIVALLLTLSRAGLVAGIAAIVLWMLLSRERVEGGLLLVAAGVPAALVAGWAFTRPALVEGGAERADRVSDGAVFGVLTLVGAGLVAALVALGVRHGLDPRLRRRAGRSLFAAAGLAAAIGIAALVVAVGNPVTWFDEEVTDTSCSEVVNDPSRIGSLNLNNRWCWWNEAWDVYADHSPEGAGAGTFEVARKRYRTDGRNVLEPHSVPLQQLADGGVVALALLIALAAAAAFVAADAVRRLDGAERAAAVALVAAPAAYFAHSLVDYTWDFIAATAPVMVALGVLAGAGRPAVAVRRRPFLAVASALVLAAVLVSFAFPRLSEESVRASTRALEDNDFERASDLALWARFFNPLSVEPMFAQARISESRRFKQAAELRYIQAVELQPENPRTWYELGLYEFHVLDNMCAAYRFLNDAYTLDPAGSQWVRGGPLDVSRAAVNKGACAPGS
jgi:O-antigen ligase/polysaccharide polymerase Wzy-like membrane protein